MNDYLAITRFIIKRELADFGQAHLRSVGERGLEGFVLWAGRVHGNTIRVEHVLVPRQTGLRTHSGVCVYVDGPELHRINVLLYDQQLRLVAQVHSHPTDAYHSDTDDEFAIATILGSLSFVIPDFAARPFDLSDCAVYRLFPYGWTEIPQEQVPVLIGVEE
jgi:proteasome lid subunit RPN8/RPN11